MNVFLKKMFMRRKDMESFLGTVAAGPYSWHLSFPLRRIYFLSVHVFVLRITLSSNEFVRGFEDIIV